MTKEMEKQVNPEKWVEGLINDIYWREYYLKKDKEENDQVFHFCFTPFTYLDLIFRFLSYPIPFQNLPSFHSPTYFSPSE